MPDATSAAPSTRVKSADDLGNAFQVKSWGKFFLWVILGGCLRSTAPKYLIRDNDRAFGGVFKARVRAARSGFSNVTNPATMYKTARQITEAFPWDTAPKYLIRDNDGAFGGVFKARLRAMGIRDQPTSYRSPWQNGHTERLIGSVSARII